MADMYTSFTPSLILSHSC